MPTVGGLNAGTGWTLPGIIDALQQQADRALEAQKFNRQMRHKAAYAPWQNIINPMEQRGLSYYQADAKDDLARAKMEQDWGLAELQRELKERLLAQQLASKERIAKTKAEGWAEAAKLRRPTQVRTGAPSYKVPKLPKMDDAQKARIWQNALKMAKGDVRVAQELYDQLMAERELKWRSRFSPQGLMAGAKRQPPKTGPAVGQPYTAPWMWNPSPQAAGKIREMIPPELREVWDSVQQKKNRNRLGEMFSPTEMADWDFSF